MEKKIKIAIIDEDENFTQELEKHFWKNDKIELVKTFNDSVIALSYLDKIKWILFLPIYL